MEVTAPVATYRSKQLFGKARNSGRDHDTDPRSFGLTFDDPDGHFRLDQITLGPQDAVISKVSSTGYRSMMRDHDHYTLVFQRVGRYDLQISGREYGMPQGSLLAFRPNERNTQVKVGKSGLRCAATVQLPVARMNQLAQSMQTTVDKAIPRDGMGLQGKASLTLSRILPQLADDLMMRPSEPPPPRVALEIRQVIEEVLCELIGQSVEPSPSHRLFPAFHRVRQVEELMHANSDEALSMQEIAQDVGVSLRSLQLAFAEVYGGLSPRDVLNRIRLEKARARLLAADGDVQVTSVAMDSGLFHLGRFSQAYARTFGEKPSETLQRRRTS